MTETGEASGPPPLPRAQRSIVAFFAKCNDCQFDTLHPQEASVHCLSQGHRLAETRHYRLEPPQK